MIHTQPAVTEPHEVEADVDRLAQDDIDTIAETRPLPEPDPAELRRANPESLPTIGHIGRYALKHVIGEGGLGTVYAAHDPLLSRLIAIKTLHVDLPQADRAQFNALFLNEARAAGSLNHPHIVTLHDAGTSEQGTYIAMELLKGKDLRQLLAMGWKPTPEQAALIVRRVADALSYAHHKGVIHRDIKPANIFMVGRTQPRVLDFGIARIRQAESLPRRDDAHSRFQEIVGGSPFYMSPEQARREPGDRRVDVYALGVVLYELLVFRRAFGGETLEDIADAVLRKPVPTPHDINPDVPKALSEIVMRAIRRDPEQRTRSARRLSQELRDWLDEAEGSDVAVSSAARRARGARPLWHKPGVWLLAGVTLVAAVTGVWWQRHAVPQGAVLAQAQPQPQAKPHPDKTAQTPPEAQGLQTHAGEQGASTAPAATTALAMDAGTKAVSPSGVAAPATAPAAAPAEGVVRLAISPWGEVWVDGVAAGVTPPLSQLKLPAGRHTIVVRNGDAPVFQQTVAVQGDKPVQLHHQF